MQCRESKESDCSLKNIFEAQLPLHYWDDLEEKRCSVPTSGRCVKIPEPKRANSKNKQRFYKEPTRRGHSKVKLSQALFYFNFPATTVHGQKRDCKVFCWRGGQNINSNSFKVSWPAPDPSWLCFCLTKSQFIKWLILGFGEVDWRTNRREGGAEPTIIKLVNC